MKEKSFKVNEHFFQKALYRASKESYAICLHGNQIPFPYGSFPTIIAFGAKDSLILPAGNAIASLRDFHKKHQGWLFGYLGYDLKNEIENLKSTNADQALLPDLAFFSPLHILFFDQGGVTILSPNPDSIYLEISNWNDYTDKVVPQVPSVKCNMSRETYLEKVKKVRQHIYEGDVYELNLCMEFFSEPALLSPEDSWLKLLEFSPAPFSAYLKLKDQYLLSASPERFLKKVGKKLITQPIKGTSRRGTDKAEDELLKQRLKSSEKEQAENMMITDLCRNDLAQSSTPGSVIVEELFGIYTFAQVHQMISTVVSEMLPEKHWSEAIRNAFPMGSMTGAPKIRAMELIDALEESKRGLFSGATGYIAPNGDFDFNVVIRSIIYNKPKQYLSFHAGSAITWDSVPEDEYQECLLKTKAIRQLLNQPLT
ncbi:anthranilate synthase component I family protein [Cytophagaceae bacterium ABcell3]|nr:anthranilate synthase component I family protein [Cytophagaceae bacterium ABcell3]